MDEELDAAWTRNGMRYPLKRVSIGELMKISEQVKNKLGGNELIGVPVYYAVWPKPEGDD